MTLFPFCSLYSTSSEREHDLLDLNLTMIIHGTYINSINCNNTVAMVLLINKNQVGNISYYVVLVL